MMKRLEDYNLLLLAGVQVGNDNDDDIYIMMKCLFVTKNDHFPKRPVCQPWKIMKTDLEPWKTMKPAGKTIETNQKKFNRPVMEVIIFRYRQTHMHHNIYIIEKE